MSSFRNSRGVVFRRVLVIEDDEVLAREIAQAFEELGAEVVGPADRLDRAMELAETAEFDCALVDINLEGAMAFPVADILLRRTIPFAFVTGYASSIPERYKKVPRIDKPVDAAAIARAFAT